MISYTRFSRSLLELDLMEESADLESLQRSIAGGGTAILLICCRAMKKATSWAVYIESVGNILECVKLLNSGRAKAALAA